MHVCNNFLKVRKSYTLIAMMSMIMYDREEIGMGMIQMYIWLYN